MILFLYTMIVIFATTIGSLAGLGGGVIIKPLFDLLGAHDVATIGFYSSVAVFTMAVVALIKQARNKAEIDLSKVVYIGSGSIIGGILGDTIFNSVNEQFSTLVSPIQSFMLGTILLILLIYSLNKTKIKSYDISNKLLILIVGILLGTISVFIGIGGGPLNIAILMFLFSYDTKQSTILSIVIILFSQSAKLLKVLIFTGIGGYDLEFLPFIIVASIFGGWFGTVLNKQLAAKQIDTLYNIVLGMLILLSYYNLIW
ncbi:MAG: sulfite exporter TauE/SafE family protein [Anaerorhabdus sp.]